MPRVKKLACITLDLESDYAGITRPVYRVWNQEKIKKLLSLLKKYNVGLSVFVVANTLGKSGVINVLRSYGAEFHLHSYSHDMASGDSKAQITKGVLEFQKYFKRLPYAYRTPSGLITKRGLEILKGKGFKFDSSIFPSFWPKPSYFFSPNRPFFISNGLLEIPISTVGPFRLLLGLSWIKLIGWKIYKKILDLFPPPNPLVFYFHLHDLWRVDTFNRLALMHKFRYLRGSSDETKVLEDFLKYLKVKKYQFITIGELASSYL
jgi:peptidoglycan/xylan/chitin deacetylase (PgdA/CDA1 family)